MAKKVRFFLKRSSKVEISGKTHVIIPFHLATVILLFAMIVISLFLALRSDIIQIKSINLAGPIPECATEDGIKLTTEAVGASTIFYDLGAGEKKILGKFYCIEKTKITKIYPSTLKIELTEKTAVAAGVKLDFQPDLLIATSSAAIIATNSASEIATQAAFFALDKSGVIFKNLPATSALPKVYLNSQLVLGAKIIDKEVLWLLNFLKTAESLNLNFADFIKTVQGWLIGEMNDGVRIILSSDSDPLKTAYSLQAILRQAKIEGAKFKILDLRFEKPILK